MHGILTRDLPLGCLQGGMLALFAPGGGSDRPAFAPAVSGQTLRIHCPRFLMPRGSGGGRSFREATSFGRGTTELARHALSMGCGARQLGAPHFAK